MSQATVGWLLLAAAALTFVLGAVSRLVVGAHRDSAAVRRIVRMFRRTDVLDDDELDAMILMPSIVVACGLALTAVFLLGYQVLA